MMRESPIPLRQRIIDCLKGHPRATAAEIAKATAKADFPSEVVNELNAMRIDLLVAAAKAKGEGVLRYSLLEADKGAQAA